MTSQLFCINHTVVELQYKCFTVGAGDKVKTAKEEVRELQLKEEAIVREKVGSVQKNLTLMVETLGELAVANSVYTHSQLPSLVSEFVFFSDDPPLFMLYCIHGGL
jgi:hypothetical protein